MKLINDFFEVIEYSETEVGFRAAIKLNPNHIVYSGHFPGHPVTPGVIQIQIVHELLEKHFGRKLKLETMSNCKFLKVLNPVETVKIVIHVELKEKEEIINVKAWSKNGSDIYFKLNSIVTIQRGERKTKK